MEEIDYSMLYRWFVGMNLDEPVWDATVFTKNRNRLLEGDVACEFLCEVVSQAQAKGLTSDEHFTVDGTLIEAWASMKSFQPKDRKKNPPDDPGNPTVNFHGETRRNDTHQSTTDADARLARKGNGKEAKLSYTGNLLTENRNGLIVSTELFQANGTAERDAALVMLERVPTPRRITVGADKGYDTKDFITECRRMNVTPHVAQNTRRNGGSAVDGRTTRHAGFAVSQRKRKRIEECFGWLLQAGFFYKDLSDPIYPTVSFVPASDPNFAGYLRQQSINGPSAHIAGFETAWQQRLSFLPGLLSGFGVSANYSYTASQVAFPVGFSSSNPGGIGRIDHPGLQRQAPNTWNLGFTYDKSRFSMRFGASHNDANIYAYGYVHNPDITNVDKDPILGLKGPLADQYLYAHTQYDIQGSYRLYRGLEFIASGLNLSNEVFGFYTGSPIYPNQREYYKPSVILGVRWVSAVER